MQPNRMFVFRLYYDDASVMLDKEIAGTLPGTLSGVSTVLFSFDLDRSSFNTPVRVDRTMSAKIAPVTVNKPPSTAGEKYLPSTSDGDFICK